MAEEQSAEATAESAAPAKKMKLNPMLLGLGLQTLLLLGGAGIMVKASLFTKRPVIKWEAVKEKAIVSARDEESKIEVLDLEDFVVNLPNRKTLKAHIQLEISNSEVKQKLLAHRPAVRARILSLLGAQTPAGLGQLQNKLMLKDAIREALNEEVLNAKRSTHGNDGEIRKPASHEAEKASLPGVVRDVYLIDMLMTKG